MSVSTFDREALAPRLRPSWKRLQVLTPAPAPARVASRWTPKAPELERLLTFVLPFLTYVWIGQRIASAGLVPGDALTRTANASATLLSRDPHLEALGFVWSPVPALVQIPLIPLGRLWRPIISEGMGAVIVSAFFTAWMLTAVRRWLVDAEVKRWTRVALVALLALHPLVLLSASNGMSESALICFLALTALHLSRWFDRGKTIDLVRTGVAVALAYLCRYEAAGAVVAVVAVVGAVAHRRAKALQRPPWADVRLRVAVVGIPPFAAVATWAFVSWAIVGEPFGHFTSKYGNAEQVVAGRAGIEAAAGAVSGLPRATYFGLQLLAFGAVAMLAALVLMWWGTRGALRLAAATAALGAPLGFQLASAVAGSTFPMARFVICVAPLAVMLVGCAVVNLAERGIKAAPALFVLATAMATLLAIVMVRDARYETDDEAAQLSAVPWPYGLTAHRPSGTILTLGRQIAHDIDALDPGHGEVLVDEATAGSMAVVLNAADQRDYIIDSDRDFERAVADPGTWGVRYLLIPDPAHAGFDALNDQYPRLFVDGAGISHLVSEWHGATNVDYRLYELDAGQRVR